jgi:hypothetical protein
LEEEIKAGRVPCISMNITEMGELPVPNMLHSIDEKGIKKKAVYLKALADMCHGPNGLNCTVHVM